MILSKDNFCIEKSKDGFNILRIEKQNKKVYVGSKYKMKDQIDKFIENIKKEAKEDSVFVIFGISAGEELKKVSKIYNNKIIIFEPNINLLDYIKANPEKYIFLKQENVYLINSQEDNLQSTIKSIIKEYELGKIVYRSIINYDKVYNEEFLEFNKILKEVISDKVIMRNTNIVFSETWFNTLINNLEYIIKSIPMDMYKDKYKNIPAIIVSAGPSLEKNIDDLRYIDGDILILTGGRTLRPLLEKKIKPHLLGIVDPGKPSYKLVQGYIDDCNLPLLFYEGTNKEVIKHHKAKKMIFTQSKVIQEVFNQHITNLGVGGSIAHTLTMSAILMGCNPIIFIGQDLAYTGEKFHADIAINQFINKKENIVKDEGNLYVEDINGYQVRTNEVLNSFKRELEEIISQNSNVNFINATEGGAKIKGTKQMTLKQAIKKYKVDKKIDFFNEDINIDYELNKENAIKVLNKTLESGDIIKNKCKKALDILNDIYVYIKSQNSSKVNKSLKRLDEIDEDIKIAYKELEILNNLIYPTVYAILSDSQKEKDEDIIEKNKFLYKSILEKIEYSLEPIQSTLNKIKSMEI